MRYAQVYDGEWIKPTMKKHRMACCDCGLVHVIDFKIIKSGRGFAIMLRALRNNRMTAAKRRKKK